MERLLRDGKPRAPWRRRLILLGVLLVACATLGFAYANRNVHHVSVSPGEATELEVQIQMQRPWRSKNFAADFGLPVTCVILAPARGDDVTVSVLETGHGLHEMWAKLEVTASAEALPGKRERRLDFAIDGENDWPQPVLRINVR